MAKVQKIRVVKELEQYQVCWEAVESLMKEFAQYDEHSLSIEYDGYDSPEIGFSLMPIGMKPLRKEKAG